MLNPVRNKAILTKMVVVTIWGHFVPVHLPAALQPLLRPEKRGFRLERFDRSLSVVLKTLSLWLYRTSSERAPNQTLPRATKLAPEASA